MTTSRVELALRNGEVLQAATAPRLTRDGHRIFDGRRLDDARGSTSPMAYSCRFDADHTACGEKNAPWLSQHLAVPAALARTGKAHAYPFTRRKSFAARIIRLEALAPHCYWENGASRPCPSLNAWRRIDDQPHNP
jgi:hypothetical protein